MRIAEMSVIACVLLLVCCGGGVLAGEVLDPHATTLPIYLLPESAAADGNLAEWEGVPPVTSDKFKLGSGPTLIEPSDSFAPTLRCGRKKDSIDLYFLVVVRDSQVWAEPGNGWLSGDFLEIWLDFGRAKRVADNPEWHKKGVTGLPEAGQFGFQPRTLMTNDEVRHAMKAKEWKVDYVSVPVEGGTAYEVRLDTQSVLDVLKMEKLSPFIGIDVGITDEDYPVKMKAGAWSNQGGFYRLFGNNMNHAFVTRYGMLSTEPTALPKQPAVSLPKTLPALYGKSPGADDIRKAIGKLPADQLGDLVYWAGLNGLKPDADLVREIMGAGSPRAQEACLLVLRCGDRDEEAIRAAVDRMYKTLTKGTPLSFVLANLANQDMAIGRREELGSLLIHDAPTVAFTAARALAAVGEAEDISVLERALDAVDHELDAKAAKGDQDAPKLKGAYMVYFREALDTLLARTVPIPLPKSVTEREIKPANTDSPRHMPVDNNNVYDGIGLARTWPNEGPKELWRAEVGEGLNTVVEAGGRAFAVGKIGTELVAQCLDAATGKLLWRKALKKENFHANGPPVVDGDRVYFVPQGVVCLNVKDGSEVWSEEGKYVGVHYSAPLIVGNVLYLGASRPAGLIAIDKNNGEVLWQAAEGMSCSPGSPSYQVIEGMPQVIIGVAKGQDTPELWGVNAKTGELFWKRPFNATNGVCSSPVATGSRLLLCAGHGPRYSECLQMYVEERKIKTRLVYHRDGIQFNSHNTPAVVNGLVYGFGKGGLQCSRLDDGSLVWQEKWSTDRHLVIADGLLYTVTPKGDLVMAEVNEEGYKELGRAATNIKLSGNTQQMTIARGRLYLRGSKQVACYDLTTGE